MTDENPLDDLENEPDTTNSDENDTPADAESPESRGWRERTRAAGRNAGEGLGKAAVFPFKASGLLAWSALEGILIGGTKLVPKGSGFWQTWLKVGYKNLKRASGADRINHVMNQGHILHKPIYWNSRKDRWETKGATNWWNGGQQHNYVGPGGVPCSWGAARATELGNQVQSEVAEALELGIEQDLYRYANVQIQNMSVNAESTGSGSAVADGGAVSRGRVNVKNPGILEDQVVNLNALYVDDAYEELAEGRLVSMDAYYETYPETTDSEEMQKQEDRGLLANMQDDDVWKKALYLMGLAFAFVLVWEYAPVLIGSGGGGGGVGGMLPW